MGSLDVIRFKQSLSTLLPAKEKHHTSGVSAKGTLMLKSVMTLMSKQRSRVLGTQVQISTGEDGTVGWWVWCAMPRYCCQSVQDDMARTVRGQQHRHGSSCGRGSVALTSTTGLDGDLLGVHEGEPA
ncbi:hypothetical protein TIFTF001_012525 [Ficus carica]|uniref:Uncharacterized protein n=1 Tax=Ficus carica TaxID=3494 RepID=A0AA88ACG1_FICCA|nr:hypothetical protein TIFTF001_012525 [Ficus carica]